MKRYTAIILLLLALLPLAGFAEDDEFIPGEADAAVEEVPGEAGALGPLEPEATEAPRATAAPKKGDEIPWLTSYNYPKGKVNFENEIWSTLTGRWGLEDFQAAGLMSSIQAESGFCPYNAQGRGGSDDRGNYRFEVGDAVGFGLCQWTSSSRKAALLRHAEAHGSAELVWDFDIQMGYMGSEIDMASLKSTHNLYEASEWAVMFYERPDQRHANSWPGTRYEMGKRIYRAHTGRDYEEPELRFSILTAEGGEIPPEGLELPAAGEGVRIAVRGNYYWRLEVAGETEGGWLRVEAPAFYRPEQMEPCECGYVCDGDKILTLSVDKIPPLGQTYGATLRFELWRGGHEHMELPVRVTCTPRDVAAILGRADFRAAAVGVAAALIAAGQ